MFYVLFLPLSLRGVQVSASVKKGPLPRNVILYSARSPLYRRQFLQPKRRWKALDEIYKIHILSLRKTLNFSVKKQRTFFNFLSMSQNLRLKNPGKFAIFHF